MFERKVSPIERFVSLMAVILGLTVVNPSYSHTSWHDAYIMHNCANCPSCCVEDHEDDEVDYACAFLMDLTAPHAMDEADWCDRPGFMEPDQRMCCVWDIEWMWCTTRENPCTEWEYVEDGC